jgi:hypothetical protein
MPDDAVEQVLHLVADGRLTADEAGPILDALAADGSSGLPEPPPPPEPLGAPGIPGRASAIRIEVTERGRRIVNLRIPVSLGRMALDHVPGLSRDDASLIRQALAEGRTGPILVVDDDDTGVRIVLE